MSKTYELELSEKIRDRFGRAVGKMRSDWILYDEELQVLRHVIFSEICPDGLELNAIQIELNKKAYDELEQLMQEHKDDVDFRTYEYEPESETA